MNEVSKSVIRRAGYVADTARMKREPIPPLEITENELSYLWQDVRIWIDKVPMTIDGVLIKVKRND